MEYTVTNRNEKSNKIIYYIGNENLDLSSYGVNSVWLKPGDWFDELSLWPIDEFKGNGKGTLAYIFSIIDSIEEGLEIKDRIIIGYSLAGLFSLYAKSEDSRFTSCGSVSGSLWYPDFLEYFNERCNSLSGKIYLSLGNKEENTKHKLMKHVGNNTREIAKLLEQNANVTSLFEYNEGGHFNEPDKRVLKGINYLLGE